jgi:hypothetical protein
MFRYMLSASLAIVLVSLANAAIAPAPVGGGGDPLVTPVAVFCGPLSQNKAECHPKPKYSHHHQHCYWHAGRQTCR